MYLDNDKLREAVVKYNSMNLSDTGDWCAKYLKRRESKHGKGGITDEQLSHYKNFIKQRQKHIVDLNHKYANFSKEEKLEYDKEFESVKNELFNYITLIVNGRANSFNLRTQLDYDDLGDVLQNGLISVLRYINRYDESLDLSAFAYVTQIVNNSFIHDLNEIKERRNKYITGLDFYDNLNTNNDVYGYES